MEAGSCSGLHILEWRVQGFEGTVWLRVAKEAFHLTLQVTDPSSLSPTNPNSYFLVLCVPQLQVSTGCQALSWHHFLTLCPAARATVPCTYTLAYPRVSHSHIHRMMHMHIYIHRNMHTHTPHLLTKAHTYSHLLAFKTSLHCLHRLFTLTSKTHSQLNPIHAHNLTLSLLSHEGGCAVGLSVIHRIRLP